MPTVKKPKTRKPRVTWTVYILTCGDGSLYTGITNDLDGRLEKHRSGKGAKYTRGRGPLTLSYSETCRSKSRALKREIAIKSLSRAAKQLMLDKKP